MAYASLTAAKTYMSNSNSVHVFAGLPDLSSLEISTGDWVVVKPNLVKQHKENDETEWESVITSPELISHVVDYACSQVGASGRVTVCDAPQTDSSFAEISARLGLAKIASSAAAKYGTSVEIFDLRNEEWTSRQGIIVDRRKLAGDPSGAVCFDLGKKSFFYGFRGEGRYYGADYDSGVVNSHHSGEKQEYLICGTPVRADVFINLPKLKTHKKTGVTLSLKNLVGINADKNWLPHHTEGSPRSGGDEFPDERLAQRIERFSVKFARSLALKLPAVGPRLAQKLRRAGTVAFGSGNEVVRSGNWFGNDTTWRMVLDLNRCLLYGQPDGTFAASQRKRYYTVVDGLIGMEGMGPMQGDPVRVGVTIVGIDPAAVDAVAATLMGFDYRRLPVIARAFEQTELPVSLALPESIAAIMPTGAVLSLRELARSPLRRFQPHFGWRGAIELTED